MMFRIADIDDAEAVFPVSVKHLMPPMKVIPDEFKNCNKLTPWNQLVSDWFFHGIEIKEATPKKGIDTKKALRHVGTILRSFEPQHEHKEAACAYLLSQWFDEITYERRKKA